MAFEAVSERPYAGVPGGSGREGRLAAVEMQHRSAWKGWRFWVNRRSVRMGRVRHTAGAD
jgi:hypothetical protein